MDTIETIRAMGEEASPEDRRIIERIVTEIERRYPIICSCGCGARKANDGVSH